ncbi:hypothetical protein ABPG74_021218 [Tetrahymena malaccensis]
MKYLLALILLGILANTVLGNEFQELDRHLFRKLNHTLQAYNDRIEYYQGQINETQQIIQVLTPYLTNLTFAHQQFQEEFNLFQFSDGQPGFSPKDVGALLYNRSQIYKVNAFPRDVKVLPSIFAFYNTDHSGVIDLPQFIYADYSLYTEFYGQKYRQLDQLNQNLTQTVNSRERHVRLIKDVLHEANEYLEE